MSKNQKPSWLTQEAVEKGMSLTVINFLSGKIKSLNDSHELTWKEFFFLYDANKDRMKGTRYFKKRIEPFLTMQENESGKALMKEIEGIINDIPGAKYFFRQRIPVVFAVNLCDSFWQYYQLWNEAKSKSQQRIILDRAQEVLATSKIDHEMLKDYWKMTVDYPNDRKVMQALIGCLIENNIREAIRLAKEIPFTDNQMTALMSKIENDKDRKVDFENCLGLFSIIRLERLLPLLEKLLSQKSSQQERFQNEMNLIYKIIGKSNDEDREFMKKSLFPLLVKCIRGYGVNAELSRNGTRVIEHLPKYVEGNAELDAFLDEIIRYYSEDVYRLTYDRFILLYSYAPKKQFIELYLDGFGRHGYNAFMGAKKSFELCGELSILGEVISKELPLLSEVNDDFLSFFDWIESQRDTQFGNDFKNFHAIILAKISSRNLLQKWLEPILYGKKSGLENFLKIANRFE